MPLKSKRVETRIVEHDWKRVVRLAFVAAGVIACVIGMFGALRIGHARSAVKKSRMTGSLSHAIEAVRLSPGDPEGYSARAMAFATPAELLLRVEDLRRAISLRPRDYKMWTELAKALDQLGDADAALAALAEARALAPFYAGPHWQTGLLLQKLGQQDKAFSELRKATLTQPSLLRQVIEMAWEAYSGNCEAVQRAIDPRTSQEMIEVAHFFVRNGKASEALGVVRSVNRLPYSERRQFVIEFLEDKRFGEAYELWTGMREKNSSPAMPGTIDDGSFESGRVSDEPGFAWKINNTLGTNLSIDQSNSKSGQRSFRIDWQGSLDPSEELLSQIVLVKPNTQYHLSFFARAQELLTGGAPLIVVTDISQMNNQILARSSRLPVGTSDWTNTSLSFSTTNSTSAVRVGLRRDTCSEHPCPVFGSLWLDDFSLIQQSTDLKTSQEQHVSSN